MKLEKVDMNNVEQLQTLYNFYHRHYDAPDYLLPKKTFNKQDLYYILKDEDQVLAVTKYQYPSPFALLTSGTVVHKEMRGQGIGEKLNELTEEMAKENGITKITCQIYVDNIASVILKLKRGYLVEGLLRDHDEIGQHEYILGKRL
jgi:RimJ/RimL family protein N-acetyltransferase